MTYALEGIEIPRGTKAGRAPSSICLEIFQGWQIGVLRLVFSGHFGAIICYRSWFPSSLTLFVFSEAIRGPVLTSRQGETTIFKKNLSHQKGRHWPWVGCGEGGPRPGAACYAALGSRGAWDKTGSRGLGRQQPGPASAQSSGAAQAGLSFRARGYRRGRGQARARISRPPNNCRPRFGTAAVGTRPCVASTARTPLHGGARCHLILGVNPRSPKKAATPIARPPYLGGLRLGAGEPQLHLIYLSLVGPRGLNTKVVVIWEGYLFLGGTAKAGAKRAFPCRAGEGLICGGPVGVGSGWALKILLGALHLCFFCVEPPPVSDSFSCDRVLSRGRGPFWDCCDVLLFLSTHK